MEWYNVMKFGTSFIREYIATLKKEMQWFENRILNIPSLVDRLDITMGSTIVWLKVALVRFTYYIKVKNDLIKRFYVRDPSFINWQAIHLMMPRDIIADFSLINKNCDLSYAGSDL